MLHIVQVVIAGMAEKPLVFLDQTEAESAFVEHVKQRWKQSFSVYCEHNGVGIDSFASAKAFLDTLDLSEKNKINYWVVSPENTSLDTMKNLEGLKRQENIGKLVRQVAQRSTAIRNELSGLADDIAQLSKNSAELNIPTMKAQTPPPAEVQPVSPKTAAIPFPATEKKAEPEADAEKYKTKEWKSFVGLIKNIAGGGREGLKLLPRTDWRQEVYDNSTSFEYWEWVAAKIDSYKEKAEKAEYSVIPDPDSPGHFKFKTPEGTLFETSFFSEWEAWCYAGMQLAKNLTAEHE